MKRSYLIASIFAAVLFTGLPASRSLAAPGGVNAVFTPFSYVDTTSCAFPLQVQGTSYDMSSTVQQTGNGFIQRFSFHGSGTVGTNGVMYRFVFNGQNTLSVNFDTGTFASTTSGLQEHVNVPGAGLVIADIGHLVYTYDPNLGYFTLTLAAGQHDFSVSSYSGLCQYFLQP